MPTLLESAPAAADWLAARMRGTLRSDSRAVQRGDAFVAWPGGIHDGRAFVPAALAAGAAACVVEADGAEAFAFDDARIALLAGLKAATGEIADRCAGSPSARLAVIAITGTNGKTSTAWWTAQALSTLGRRCGVIGTLGVGEPGAMVGTGLTTPDPVTLQATLKRFADDGFAGCAIEASSIGIVEHRLAALRIRVAVFTNFTRDHLDFHGDMAAYWAAKRALFDWAGLAAAVVNIDDTQGAALHAELAGRAGLDVWSVSLRAPARLQARELAYVDGGLSFELHEGSDRARVRSQLVGDFNASNLLGVIATLRALGIALADACAAVSALTPVPGRLQRLSAAGLEVVVDYAHTPDALEKTLQALQPLARSRGGRLWCVFGCGGNRDASKRPLMGAIAAAQADCVVVTSDNPRDEAPAAILAQILAGVTGHDDVAVIDDRRAAITDALTRAQPGDVVLLAGKGHEDYQEIAGVKRPFSDIEVAAAVLRGRTGAAA